MNNEQIRLLSKMKKLVSEGSRRFQLRLNRDYLVDLLELGICEEEAWNQILGLNTNLYFPDPKPSFANNNALTFKRLINNNIAYIKISLEKATDGEFETVCLSFHKDYKEGKI